MNGVWSRLEQRLQSVRHALAGVWLLLRTQPNAWIHAIATVVVTGLGLVFHLTTLEWACLAVATMGVWTAEAINTAIELLGDAVSTDFHPLVGKAKDVAAGAVLISALFAVVVGLLVLGPHVLGVV